MDELVDADRSSALSKQWRHVPRLILDALRVAWLASPRQFVATLLVQTAAGASMALQLLAAKEVLAKLLAIDSPDVSGVSLAPAVALLIGAMAAFGALVAIADQRQRLLGELVAQHAFAQIIDVSAHVDLEAFEDPEFHDQLERARVSASYRSVQMVNSVGGLTLNLLTSAGIVVALLFLQPILLPLVLLAATPLLAATLHNSRNAYTFEWGMTPENRERAYLIELLTARDAAKEVRVFGAARFLRTRYQGLTAERLRRMRKFLRRRLRVALGGTLASSLGMGIAIATLSYLVAAGSVDVATAVAAGAAVQQLGTRMTGAMTSIGQLVESGMFVDDYNSFLQLSPAREEISAVPAANGRSVQFGGLSIEGVSFGYPGTKRRVLEDVSLEIQPGEVVALVGENGSGKTTLVKLICQLYRAQTGNISWAGLDGEPVGPEQVRDDTTVLFQDFLQYHLTAADNIALGRVERDPTAKALEAAAKQSGAHDLLAALPAGYDTRLGREFVEGQELSIGQWQRLALARAFFRGGGFLVLDEPTASLDPRAEHALFGQMRALWRGRSVLLVSHRFSSVRSADRIYVLRGGRITESGTHTELLDVGGHYAELFSLQAAAYLGDGPTVSPPRKNDRMAGVRVP